MRLLLALFLATPVLCQGQKTTEISHSFYEYFGYKAQGDYAKFSSYLPDELIQLMPPPQLEASITQSFQNIAFSILVADGTINSISEEVQHGDIRYASVSYSYVMTITMNDSTDFGMFDFVLQSLRNTVPQERITADVAEGKIVVNQTSLMYAIHKPRDRWKFLEVNSQLKEIAHKIIPPEVIETI